MHSIPWRRSKFMAKKKKHKPKKKQKKNARARRRFVESRGPPKEQVRKKERKGRKFFFCFFVFFMGKTVAQVTLNGRHRSSPRRRSCSALATGPLLLLPSFLVLHLVLLVVVVVVVVVVVSVCSFLFVFFYLGWLGCRRRLCRCLPCPPRVTEFFFCSQYFVLPVRPRVYLVVHFGFPALFAEFFFGFRPFFFLNRVSSARLCSCEIVFLYRVWFLFSFAQRSKYGNISRWFA